MPYQDESGKPFTLQCVAYSVTSVLNLTLKLWFSGFFCVKDISQGHKHSVVVEDLVVQYHY